MVADSADLASAVPVDLLVPDIYDRWRPLIRDAMQFVVSNLSPERLTEKMLEQAALPPDTPPEQRLLRLIARMPGVQKLGQVLARNRHLDPAVRNALAELENGIHDASESEIRQVIEGELGQCLRDSAVVLESGILAEATVSAVVRFTARNQDDVVQGVFKVLKPGVRTWFEEDLRILQSLAEHLSSTGTDYGFNAGEFPEMIADIRLLLEHELDFPREQSTLRAMYAVHEPVPGVRVPRVIPALSTPSITAMTFEPGVKVTEAHRGSRFRRARVAEQVIEALIAAPLFSPAEAAVFHADPHAGNLLYDEHSDELVILDWALAERLTREQRRQFTTLVIALVLRNTAAVADAIRQLSGTGHAYDALIRQSVERAVATLPWTRVPGSMDAVQLLDEIALQGLPFPAPLLLFRKMLFTLDGVLHEIAGDDVSMDSVLVREAVARSFAATVHFWMPQPGNCGFPCGVPLAG